MVLGFGIEKFYAPKLVVNRVRSRSQSFCALLTFFYKAVHSASKFHEENFFVL